MDKFENLDDLTLGAFVDGHLDAEHSETVIRAMENDSDIREQVYKLRRTKDLMKLGFGTATAPSDKQQVKPRFWSCFIPAIAASITFLAVSVGAGAVGYHYYTEQTGTFPVVASAAQQQAEQIILHISESDPDQFAAALAYAEKFLHEQEARGNQIEVVANAGGIDFLRINASPFRDQVVTMMREHDNVHFVACANAIRALRKKGIEPVFIQDTSTDKTAMDHIIERVQSDWTYIKVASLPEV